MPSAPDPCVPDAAVSRGSPSIFAHPAPDRYILAKGVRLRPVPEFAACLAYVPGSRATRPALHRLNVTSWLIASLCDGRSLAAVTAGFAVSRPGPNGDAALHQGLQDLLLIGVLRIQPAALPNAPAHTETLHEPA